VGLAGIICREGHFYWFKNVPTTCFCVPLPGTLNSLLNIVIFSINQIKQILVLEFSARLIVPILELASFKSLAIDCIPASGTVDNIDFKVNEFLDVNSLCLNN
jgi:hypothetical protein